jgi:hypothetical protein
MILPVKLISSAAAPGDFRSEASEGAFSLRPLLLCQRLYTYSSQRELLLCGMCGDYTYFGGASQPVLNSNLKKFQFIILRVHNRKIIRGTSWLGQMRKYHKPPGFNRLLAG